MALAVLKSRYVQTQRSSRT